MKPSHSRGPAGPRSQWLSVAERPPYICLPNWGITLNVTLLLSCVGHIYLYPFFTFISPNASAGDMYEMIQLADAKNNCDLIERRKFLGKVHEEIRKETARDTEMSFRETKPKASPTYGNTV